MIKQKTSEGKAGRALKWGAKTPQYIAYVAALILVGALGSWWYHLHTNADRVFWGMVSNNLNTSAVTRIFEENQDAQTSRQIVELQTAPTHLANSKTVITQGYDKSTRVVTESIGTPTHDYVRYTSIVTDQKSQSGAELNFSNVTGVWGKAETNPGENGKPVTNAQLYNELALSIFPFANLDNAQRSKIVSELQSSKAYKFQRVGTTYSGVLKRPTLTYNVEVSPKEYITVLKTLGTAAGLNQLTSLDPAQYESARPVNIQVRVDGWSHQLLEIGYPGGGRVERFTGYNAAKQLKSPPSSSISVRELQERLQQIQ